MVEAEEAVVEEAAVEEAEEGVPAEGVPVEEAAEAEVVVEEVRVLLHHINTISFQAQPAGHYKEPELTRDPK